MQSMYRDVGIYFIDILIAIDKIKRYTKNINSPSQLISNEIVYDAVIRELIIIGEAVNILIKNEFLDKNYRKIVDFRNIIVHGYFGIDEDILFSVIKHKLDELKNDILKIIKTRKIDVSEVLEETIKDYNSQKEVINFLNSLKEII